MTLETLFQASECGSCDMRRTCPNCGHHDITLETLWGLLQYSHVKATCNACEQESLISIWWECWDCLHENVELCLNCGDAIEVGGESCYGSLVCCTDCYVAVMGIEVEA